MDVKKLAEQSGAHRIHNEGRDFLHHKYEYAFTEDALIEYTNKVIESCTYIVETYKVSVGNSAAGEMACRWTMDALLEIRDDMNELKALKQYDPDKPYDVLLEKRP